MKVSERKEAQDPLCRPDPLYERQSGRIFERKKNNPFQIADGMPRSKKGEEDQEEGQE